MCIKEFMWGEVYVAGAWGVGGRDVKLGGGVTWRRVWRVIDRR